MRGLRHPRDEPASRPGLLVDPLLGQALRRLRHLRSPRSRRRRPGGDLARRTAGHRGRAGDHRRGQPQQPARLGLPYGRRDVGLGGGQPADRDDAVPARGSTAPVSVAAGLSLQVAEVLSGVAIAQAVRPGVGASSAPSSPASTCAAAAVAGHARVGARLDRRRPARAPLRPAVPRGWRPDVRQRAGRPGGDGVGHVALGHLSRGLRSRAPRGRLARGRPDDVLREARPRPRGAAHVRAPAHRACGRRRAAGARDDSRGGPGRDLLRGAAHARALPRLGLHQPALPLPGVSHLGEAGRRRDARGGDRRWKRLLSSYEDPGIDASIDAEMRAFMAERKRELDG